MALDSPACAALLFAAAVGGWGLAKPQSAASRLYVRFAAVLLSALAVCAGLNLGDVALLFLLPLTAGAMATAALARFVRRPPGLAASLLLTVMLALGLTAALTGWAAISLLPVALLSLVISALALGGTAPLAALGALALLAGVLAFPQQGAHSGVLMFLAAAILGLSRGLSRAAPLAAAVEQTTAAARRPAIGRLG
jgi:hypothetical protein